MHARSLIGTVAVSTLGSFLLLATPALAQGDRDKPRSERATRSLSGKSSYRPETVAMVGLGASRDLSGTGEHQCAVTVDHP